MRNHHISIAENGWSHSTVRLNGPAQQHDLGDTQYINTELKHEWYQRCKQLEHCPFGKRPMLPMADGHVSNESIEMSAEMELEDNALLCGPPGHSTHLTQDLDQTGGPIQNFKHVSSHLVKHGYRIGGKLSKARIVQQIAQGVALGVTPAVCCARLLPVTHTTCTHARLAHGRVCACSTPLCVGCRAEVVRSDVARPGGR